jgi:hypothetical protein
MVRKLFLFAAIFDGCSSTSLGPVQDERRGSQHGVGEGLKPYWSLIRTGQDLARLAERVPRGAGDVPEQTGVSAG